MSYLGRAQLFHGVGRYVGRGGADLRDAEVDASPFQWKGTLVLESVKDVTVLDGKVGAHFDLKLDECPNEPLIQVVIRHMNGTTLELAGTDPLPDCQ